MHNSRLKRAEGQGSLVWLDAGSQESSHLSASVIVESRFTMSEEQAEMLFFTLLSVFRTKLKELNFFLLLPALSPMFYPDAPAWAGYSVFNNTGAFFVWGERCSFEAIHHCRTVALWIYISGSGSMALCSWWDCFSQMLPVQVSTNGFVNRERHAWVKQSMTLMGGNDGTKRNVHISL